MLLARPPLSPSNRTHFMDDPQLKILCSVCVNTKTAKFLIITEMEKKRTTNYWNINLPTGLQHLKSFNYMWIIVQVFISHVSSYWSFYHRFLILYRSTIFPWTTISSTIVASATFYPLPLIQHLIKNMSIIKIWAESSTVLLQCYRKL